MSVALSPWGKVAVARAVSNAIRKLVKDGATVPAVAKRIGMSAGTVKRLVASKFAILSFNRAAEKARSVGIDPETGGRL